MKLLNKIALAGASALALTATTASADIACNGEGECWHVRDRVEYKPEFGVTVHRDDWKWKEHEHYKWREHEGRGYWRNGIWIDIH
jgi:hypothetical protein